MREKIRKRIEKYMPADRFLLVVFAFAFSSGAYYLARIIAGDWHHYTLTSRLDERIPFMPSGILIYFGCYLFWVVNYIMIAKQEEARAYRFFFADFSAKLICFLIFLIFPTTNIRPELSDTGIWHMGMQFLYTVDEANNLFPSIHCLVSWFCYIGVRGNRKIPLWYRAFSCVMAVLVFLSTLTTKQHVVIDVVGGVVLAEVCCLFAERTRCYERYRKFWSRVTERLFGLGERHEEHEEERI